MRAIVVGFVASLAASASAQPVQPAPPPGNPPTEPPQPAPAPTEAIPPTEATPPPPLPLVDPKHERSTAVARRLAHDGHCDLALEYGEPIKAEAPDYYTRVFVADPYIAACIAGTAPPPSAPASMPSVASETDAQEAVDDDCRPLKLYAASSLFFMNGTMWADDSGVSQSTSGENKFHRIAVGGLLRDCGRPNPFGGHVAATAVANTNVAGVGLEAEGDYGIGSKLRGGLRIGVELGGGSRITSLGARVHFFDTVFLGVDAYTARDNGFKSHGVMWGFGVEGRAGRWVVAVEAVLLSIAVVAFFAGAGPD